MQTQTTKLIWVVCKKDLFDNFYSKRFHVGAVISMILFAVTAFIRFQDFKQSHQERGIFLQRWIPAVEEQLERSEGVQVDNMRAISPMSVVSMGLEPVLPFRFSSTKEGLRFGESRGAKNTLDALFGHLDLVFVVGILLSLLAIAFTYDSICGERVQGTLAILLSYPLRRSTLIFAKILANIIVLSICVLPSYVLVIAFGTVMGVPLMNGWQWLLFIFVSLLYLSIFSAIGVTVSALVPRPSDALLTTLFVWVLFAFVAPRGIGLIVNQAHPPSTAAELTVKEEQAASQLQGEFFRGKQEAFREMIFGSDRQKSQDEFKNKIKKLSEEFAIKRRMILDRIWDERLREEASREDSIRMLSVVTPTALFNEISAELSWTGYRQRDHFYREARAYDEKIGRKLAESVQTYFSSTQNGQTGQALIQHADIKPFLVPYSTTWASTRIILSSIVGPIFSLCCYFCILVYLGYKSLLKMDVRA